MERMSSAGAGGAEAGLPAGADADTATPAGLPDDEWAASVPAAVVLGPGRRSALIVLVLRLMRAGSITVILAGAAVASAFGGLDEETAGELASVGGLVRALATPLMVLAAGIVLRLLVGPLAYLAALAVVGIHRGEVTPSDERRRPFTRWRDRLRVVGGYRSLRWTIAVKHEAVDRLGATGRLLSWAEAGIYVADVVAVLALVAVSVR